VVNGRVSGKNAISASGPGAGSRFASIRIVEPRSFEPRSFEPEASACLRASRASGRFSWVQAEDITTSPPAIRRAARVTPKKLRIGVPAQSAPSITKAA